MRKDSFPLRFYLYLKERFNLSQYIVLSLSLGLILGLGTQLFLNIDIFWPTIIWGSVALLLFLFRLRIFDEVKDSEHDLTFYPERPIPRGLISLNELRRLLFPVIMIELAISFVGGGVSFVLFVISFFYSLIMLKEFFAKKWLREHFTLYIFVHELLVIPLFLYICSVNGLGGLSVNGFYFVNLVALCFSLLFLLEITRKFRDKKHEIDSRDTYTAQYGILGASVLVGFVATVSVLTGILNLAMLNILTYWLWIIMFTPLVIVTGGLIIFYHRPTANHARLIFWLSVVFFISMSTGSIIAMALR